MKNRNAAGQFYIVLLYFYTWKIIPYHFYDSKSSPGRIELRRRGIMSRKILTVISR